VQFAMILGLRVALVWTVLSGGLVFLAVIAEIIVAETAILEFAYDGARRRCLCVGGSVLRPLAFRANHRPGQDAIGR
jgi:hypothetical protein